MPLNVPIGGIEDPGVSSLAIPGDPSSKIIMNATSSLNTQTSTRNRALSSSLNLPMSVLNDDEEYASAEYQFLKDSTNKEMAPAVNNWRNVSPENYAISKDDADEMSIIEHSLRGVSSLVGGAVTDLGRIPSGFGQLFGDMRDSFREAVLSPIKLIKPELAEAIGLAADDINNSLPWWTDPGLALEEMGLDVKETGKNISPDDPDFIEKVLGGVGGLGAQIAVLIATGGASGTALCMHREWML